MVLKTSDVVYVERNYTLLRRYLRKKYPFSEEDRDLMEQKFLDYQNATITRTILQDFKRSNQEKIDYFLSKFDTQSLIVSVIADRGQGKTAFCTFLLEELAKRGHKIYPLFPFPCLPFMEKQVFDLSEVPIVENGKRTITYIDELAKKYKSRNFQSDDALAMTDELIELRHFEGSVIGGTQDPRLVDLNYFTLSDIKVWKFYNQENEQLTREGVLTEMVKLLMPPKDSIQDVLVVDRGEYSTFTFPFSTYSQDISKYLKFLKTPEKRQEIINYVSKYYQKTELKKVLYTQYSIKLTIDEQKEL